MNRIRVAMVTGILCLLQLISKAQTADSAIRAAIIKPYHITIGYDKTSNLIFPFGIKSVDRGSAALLVQKAKGVENILQVKAGQQNFRQTNLSVVTGDSRFYSFIVDYTDEPVVLNFSFDTNSTGITQNAFLSDLSVNEATLKELCGKVSQQKSFLHGRIAQQKMRLSLRSICLDQQTMWFSLQLKNKSLIRYQPEHFRFFIRDRKRAKRTAVQENELLPVYQSEAKVIAGQSSEKFIMAFPSFTIPKSKELIIQVTEQNGGRSLLLPVKYKTILKARLLK